MENNHTYLALTIGPIFRALSEARKTRELWGISYLFSYTMREILHHFQRLDQKQEAKVLLPYRKTHGGISNGTGMYPDRIILQIPEEKAETLDKTLQQAINNTWKELEEKITTPTAIGKIKQYLQVYSLRMPNVEGKSPVLAINQYLDTLELQQKIAYPWTDECRITDFTDIANGKHFLKDAFGDQAKGNFKFPSIPEIATTDFQFPKGEDESRWREEYNRLLKELRQGDWNAKKYAEESKQEDKFIDSIKTDPTFKDYFRSYHKYYCVVQADGDNIGQVIGAIGGDVKKIQQFSQALFDFSQAAVKAIQEYQGKPVYAGGDDLLFFAPVAVDQGGQMQTIFDLLDRIHAAFDTKVASEAKGLSVPPTLSFGIAISYYKYPLQEALETSIGNLFEVAKRTPRKNAVTFQLLKHSGKPIGATMRMKTQAYEQHFREMRTCGKFKQEFLSSIQYKLLENEAVLKALFQEPHPDDRLKSFFENSFDEWKHDLSRSFLNAIAQYLFSAWEDAKSDEALSTGQDHPNPFDQALALTYAALRFVQFIQS